MERVWSALPDARDAEIRRLTERVASAADGLRERDAEIALLREALWLSGARCAEANESCPVAALIEAALAPDSAA